MNDNRNDKIEPKGIFELRVYNADGCLVEQYEDWNLIVNGGRSAIASLIGAATSTKDVTQIAFGTNGASPVLTDTAITGAFTKAVGAVSYPATGQVRFAWSLELSESNGVTIREYGLLCQDNTLFARKVRADIAKTSDVRLEGTWTIIF
jgi:hypothetical protein